MQDKPFDPVSIEPDTLLAVQEKFFPVLDDKAGERMQKLIEHCRDQLDSVGGVIECAIAGVPAGIGDPMFDCVESKISSLLFGIPAVKGVEFGLGFGLSSLQGSQANDPFYIRENAASSKEVLTATNHNGRHPGRHHRRDARSSSARPSSPPPRLRKSSGRSTLKPAKTSSSRSPGGTIRASSGGRCPVSNRLLPSR